MGLLRTIFIILVFYYLFKFLMRIIAPYLLKMGINSMKNKFQNEQVFKEHKRQQEGRVTIQKSGDSEKKISPDLGEYVDYEEVQE